MREAYIDAYLIKFLLSIFSIWTRSRKWETFEKPLRYISNPYVGDLHAEARDHHRKLQRSQQAKTEFTALVQIPKNVQNGPLLVKDTKKSFISFVSPNEQGYKVGDWKFKIFAILRTNMEPLNLP